MVGETLKGSVSTLAGPGAGIVAGIMAPQMIDCNSGFFFFKEPLFESHHHHHCHHRCHLHNDAATVSPREVADFPA